MAKFEELNNAKNTKNEVVLNPAKSSDNPAAWAASPGTSVLTIHNSKAVPTPETAPTKVPVHEAVQIPIPLPDETTPANSASNTSTPASSANDPDPDPAMQAHDSKTTETLAKSIGNTGANKAPNIGATAPVNKDPANKEKPKVFLYLSV